MWVWVYCIGVASAAFAITGGGGVVENASIVYVLN